MPKKFKINPTQLRNKGGNYIPPVEVLKNEDISFNFKRLQVKEGKFNFKLKEAQYFLALMDRLKNLCCMGRVQILTNRSPSLRCHPIDFTSSRVSEDGFGVLGEDIDNDAWQMQISTSGYGRIHGYFVGDVFYVVWLDPEHELYPET